MLEFALLAWLVVVAPGTSRAGEILVHREVVRQETATQDESLCRDAGRDLIAKLDRLYKDVPGFDHAEFACRPLEGSGI